MHVKSVSVWYNFVGGLNLFFNWLKKSLFLICKFKLNIIWKSCRFVVLVLLHFLFQKLFFLIIWNLLLNHCIVNLILIILIWIFYQINAKKLLRNVFLFLLIQNLRNMMIFKNDLISINIIQNNAIGYIIYSLKPQFFTLFSFLKSTCNKLVEILSNIKI